MPVKKPSKVLGRSIALKAAQKRIQARSSRLAYATLNLTAMVDMFTLLVVFLLANFSATGEVLFMTKDIVLPKASATAQIMRAPVVSISAKTIGLEGGFIMTTENAASPDVTDLAELTAGLREIRSANQGGKTNAMANTVVVQCDEGVEFKVVRKVMYAAAEAGYTDLNYAVLSKVATLGEVK